MCGINGFTFKDPDLIERMNTATRHRGPDGTGVFVDEHVSLGNDLLAITDTAPQYRIPNRTADGLFVLTYNGEIYNYRELRAELEREGDHFTTASDSEVLLKGCARHGIGFVEKLDGMFAFALYDKKASKLYLARDRAGIKPLYHAFKNGRLIFSSEIRAILVSHGAILNHQAAQVFFVLGYVPGEDTMFAGIQRVMPGHILTFDLKSEKLSDSVYGFSDNRFSPFEKFDSDRFRAIMGESVQRHTMGLRPFGLYLSGGLDSTVILHELSSRSKNLVRTYTTRFDTRNPEMNSDADMALRLCNDYTIEHNELLVTEKDFIDAFDATIEALEEPRYHLSAPAYYLLAKFARKDIVVVFSGSGGDELFLGYERYLDAKKLAARYAQYPAFLLNLGYTADNIRRGKLRPAHLMRLDKTLNRWTHLNKINPLIQRPDFNMPPFDIVDLAKYLAPAARSVLRNPLPDTENSIAELDRLFWLADEDLMRSDKIMMHFGMEGRFPFLANDIVTYANNISSKDKLFGGATKALIRKAYQGRLPDYIINKKKTGWYAPTVEWLHSDFGAMIKEMLSEEYYPETARLFDLNYVRAHRFDDIKEFDRVNVKKFMPIAIFQAWARQFKINL